jgi:lipopolysaccharide/colanic/teichoic acid biosynthesis glycosyltransferase
VLEPAFQLTRVFAITYFEHPKVNSDGLEIKHIDESAAQTPAQPQRGRAPEPATFILLLSGLSGVILRFAHKSFDKFKRCLDYFFSIAGLTITSPLVAFAAFMIKLESPGPIIYKQNRVGLNGKVFRIYKLRTMRADAEKGTGAVWAKANDPRITSIGRILRKTRIDEIPQLFNVIKGEMSIVGPRPERPEIVRDLKVLIHDYERRLAVKPGITGLAQIFHKYDESIEDVKQKIKYDLLYIDRKSVV